MKQIIMFTVPVVSIHVSASSKEDRMFFKGKGTIATLSQ